MSSKQKFMIPVSFAGLLLVSLMTFSRVRNPDRIITDVEVDIKDQEGVLFTDNLEIVDLMTEKNRDYVLGIEMGKLNQKALEARIEANPFVKKAEVFRDLKGQLKVKVEQNKPIARVFNSGKPDYYIDEDGNILPTNTKYTARVSLVETAFDFPWESNLNESNYGMKLYQFLLFMHRDEFWKAQIAQILIRPDGELELYPQVTKQTVFFGQPDQIKAKFGRLMTFYKKILPQKGWNTYEAVNVKFENQIICE